MQWKRVSLSVQLLPTDMTKLPTFHIQVASHIEMECNNDLTADYMSVPNYDAVWAGIYSSTYNTVATATEMSTTTTSIVVTRGAWE